MAWDLQGLALHPLAAAIIMPDGSAVEWPPVGVSADFVFLPTQTARADACGTGWMVPKARQLMGAEERLARSQVIFPMPLYPHQTTSLKGRRDRIHRRLPIDRYEGVSL